VFGFLWTATRYFLIGLFIGYLTAPRAGMQTRQLMYDYIGAMLGELFAVKRTSETEAGVTRMRRSQP
jgi:hypothetical protein